MHARSCERAITHAIVDPRYVVSQVWKNLLAANAVFITLTANSLQGYFGTQDDTDARVPLGVYLPHFVKYLRPNSGKNILVHPEAFERAIRGDIAGQGAHDKDGILLAFASPTSTRGLPFIVDKHAIRYDTLPPALDREEISDSFSVPDDADALRRSCDDFVSILQIDQDSPHLKFVRACPDASAPQSAHPASAAHPMPPRAAAPLSSHCCRGSLHRAVGRGEHMAPDNFTAFGSLLRKVESMRRRRTPAANVQRHPRCAGGKRGLLKARCLREGQRRRVFLCGWDQSSRPLQ